jgi:hypothetical protein
VKICAKFEDENLSEKISDEMELLQNRSLVEGSGVHSRIDLATTVHAPGHDPNDGAPTQATHDQWT